MERRPPCGGAAGACGWHVFLRQLLSAGGGFAGLRAGRRIRAEEHEHLFDDCYRFRGRMLDQIYTGNVIGTSTVVFHRDSHRALRFDTRFRRAGEDYLMWSS
ncbi:MAG: hypothetical protein N2688_09210, partial [Burkholderiaceae bacterium]|nr:hypothetical protein [Burkholderiaceae bacterium]